MSLIIIVIVIEMIMIIIMIIMMMIMMMIPDIFNVTIIVSWVVRGEGADFRRSNGVPSPPLLELDLAEFLCYTF